MTIHREPTKVIKGYVSIVFETRLDIQTIRTLLGRLGTTFELFDDKGGQIKTLRRPRHTRKSGRVSK